METDRADHARHAAKRCRSGIGGVARHPIRWVADGAGKEYPIYRWLLGSTSVVVRTEKVAALYTALIVDDDPLVLDVVAQALAEPGYGVLTAHDGYEGIRVLADRHVDLIITDIMMPGLDGVQLSIQAKLMRPSLRIIYITGFADAAQRVHHGTVLEKPVRVAELIKAVQQELSAR